MSTVSLLILSKSRDIAVEATMNWLRYYFKIPVFRITDACDLEMNSFAIENYECLILNNKYKHTLQLSAIQSIWIHGFIALNKQVQFSDPELQLAVSDNITKDYNAILFPMIYQLCQSENVRWLGEFESPYQKIYQLIAAKAAGLDIPESFIVTDKKFLMQMGDPGNYITKSLDYSVYVDTVKTHVSGQRTQVLNAATVSVMKERFYASYIQSKVEKKYELRVFFFRDKFYAMAIFSQKDERTKIDFRNYNTDKPNRFVPYVLPQKIKQKLKKLIRKLNISSGSIDILVDQLNRYFFLEINYSGQFSFVSSNCNYHIEFDLAQYFSHEKN